MSVVSVHGGVVYRGRLVVVTIYVHSPIRKPI